MKWVLDRIKCWFNWHDWTCKAEQGIAPAPRETFNEYAKMYCARPKCTEVYTPQV